MLTNYRKLKNIIKVFLFICSTSAYPDLISIYLFIYIFTNITELPNDIRNTNYFYEDTLQYRDSTTGATPHQNNNQTPHQHNTTPPHQHNTTPPHQHIPCSRGAACNTVRASPIAIHYQDKQQGSCCYACTTTAHHALLHCYSV